jgi:hypothetical protein
VQNGLGYGLQFVDTDKALTKRLHLLAKDLKKGGTSFRNGQDDAWTAFKGWAIRLATTGEGLLPEAERTPARPIRQTTQSEASSGTTKSA